MTPEVVSRVKELESLCRSASRRVAVAESCTGGLLSSWICAYPGASAFYNGGVVSYARVVKERVLQVASDVITQHGEVSEEVALGMAKGVVHCAASDWAVSITGIAGPSGGSARKPVGFVCFAVVGPGLERSTHKQFEAGGGREDIQRQAALFAFDFLLNAMR